MRLSSMLAAVVSLAMSLPALAQTRTLQHSGVIAAPVDELWTALTTPDGIKKSWSVAQADVDFRLGGIIRTHYKADGVLGDGGTIIHTILAYEPGRMLALKTTKAPDTAPEPVKLICREGWVVIRFEPVSPTRTRYTETMMGFGQGEDFDKAYAFFDKGNAWTLKKMQEAFRPADETQRVADTEQALRSLVGTWEFRNERPDGTAFRGHTEITSAMNGHLLVGLGSLGDDKALSPHAHFLAYRDPESSAMRVFNINESGDITQGEARLETPTLLVLDWDTRGLATGERTVYRIEYALETADAFTFRVMLPDPAKSAPTRTLVEVHYTRVSDAPTER